MRYEIYSWTRAERREYEREYGYSMFFAAIDTDMFDIANYGSCIGEVETRNEAYQFVSSYYGGYPDDFILFWDDYKNEWVRYNPFR